MTDDAAIALHGVSKRFAADKPVLDGVELVIPKRTFMVIVGASGCGKSTLLRLINRLSDPTAGQVTAAGIPVETVDPIALRRRIGLVFQEVGLFPHMTVEENIGITPRLLGWEPDAIDRRVVELLELVRLPLDFKPRLPHQLSGGQRQRIGVARALAAKPEIMLMDEPFAALDPLTRDGLGQDYRRLHDTLQLTTLMITHDMLEALTLADRIAVLAGGNIIADGSPQEIANHTHPHVRELMQAPRRQAERAASLFVTTEAQRD